MAKVLKQKKYGRDSVCSNPDANERQSLLEKSYEIINKKYRLNEVGSSHTEGDFYLIKGGVAVIGRDGLGDIDVIECFHETKEGLIELINTLELPHRPWR